MIKDCCILPICGMISPCLVNVFSYSTSVCVLSIKISLGLPDILVYSNNIILRMLRCVDSIMNLDSVDFDTDAAYPYKL